MNGYDTRRDIFPVPFSFIAPAHLRDPYPFYDRLRSQAPVFRIPVPGFGGAEQFLVTGFHDVRAVLASSTYSSDVSARAIAGDDGSLPRDESDVTSMALLDRPAHGRVRKLVQGSFTPERIAALRADAALLADELCELAGAEDRVDFIADVAVPMTTQMFAILFGVPSDDRARLRAWADSIFSLAAGGEHSEQAESFRSLARPILEYLRLLIVERRRSPGDDLVSALANAREGDDRLTDGEILGNCWLLLMAGFEPVINLLGTGLWTLIRFPEQMDRLRSDTTLLDTAVEEMLRYESPTQAIVRIAKEDVVVGDQQIGKSSIVVCALGAANRDPAAFSRPDVFDVRRAPNHHLAFGRGAHYCIGAQLARLQASVMFPRLLDRFARLELDAEPEFRANPIQRGLRALPVRLFAA